MKPFLQFFHDNPILLSAAIVLATAFSVQMFYWIFFYARIFKLSKFSKETKITHPVSVVICARNEAENLQKNLPLILEQNYSDFEVIVVNDCSSDDSQLVLNTFKEQYKNLYVTTIHEDQTFAHGKKLALTVGIKAAKNDILVLTDADCAPASPNWLRSVVRNFSDEVQIVLMYGAYHSQNTFVNKLIRYDALFSGVQYLTYAAARIPVLGVGRNLAYRKSFWTQSRGFSSHVHLLSGDDDLFVNKNARKGNFAVEVSHESITLSEPSKTFSEYFRQKKRHVSTGKYYRFSTRFLIASEIGSRFLFYLSLIVLCPFLYGCLIAGSLYFARLILQNIILGKASRHFKEHNISIFIFIFDIILPIIQLTAYLMPLFSKRKPVWK